MRSKRAQVTLEFTMAMMATILLFAGMIRVFLWIGKSMIEQRKAHERVLMTDYSSAGVAGPLYQLKEDFYTPATFDAAVSSDLFKH
ncbi:MAG TPA: hypothetical protein P5246_00615 [Candidatus Omnitrophota bacterium]|nr:hypothetical protein [Candidatus Omnitrophota bacterium]HSA30217.1 hypothetical protein [Candidatus Omnitrophota bacterium]